MTKYPEGTRWAVRVGDQWETLSVYRCQLSSKQKRWLSNATAAGHGLAIGIAIEHREKRTDVAVVAVPPPRPKRSVEERIEELVAKSHAEWAAALVAERNAVDERIAVAVRERTEAILKEWNAPSWMARRGEGSFADWLRDLLAGKVTV